VPEDPLARLDPPVASWFRATFPAPTPAQAQAIPALLDGENVLVASPTGSGKTLAGFLALLSELSRLGPALEARPYVLYVSPLKALVNDVARNLQAPLEGIRAHALALGREPPPIRVAIRTGDTPTQERARMLRKPPHILVTTPESLGLLLVSPRWRSLLAGIRWVLVDEVHDLMPRKRGAHLSLLLEHLEEATRAPPVRIGLSATVAPLADAAAFLTGGRPCRVIDVPARVTPRLTVELVPADPVRASAKQAEDATLARIHEIVEAHATTIVFTNTRHEAERIALELHEALAEDDRVATHHGSMSREARLGVEERLKRGDLKCVVASSSLELGLDIRSVDHVVLVGSPRSSARALQRLGRSKHAVGERPEGTLLVDDPADLAEALALQSLVEGRAIEPIVMPRMPLDVLAQTAVASALRGPRKVEDELALARRSWCYRDLDRATLERALDAQPYVQRRGGIFVKRGLARLVYPTQAGTIPDDSLVRVLHGERFVGQIEGTFAASMQEGDRFRLAGRTWMHAGLMGAALRVEPARGRMPTVPQWVGEGLGFTSLVADATRSILLHGQRNANHGNAETWKRFDAWRAFLPHLGGEGAPAESFVEAEGRRALVFLAVAGRRAHEPLARVIALRLSRALGAPVATRTNDLGFALLAPRRWKPTPRAIRALLAEPLEADARAALADTPLHARRLGHVAVRSFLLRRDPRASRLKRQRQAEGLLARLEREQPDHPMLEEAWREVLHEALDLEGAEALRARLLEGVRLVEGGPSPLAARVLARLDDPEGRAQIREAEDAARDPLVPVTFKRGRP